LSVETWERLEKEADAEQTTVNALIRRRLG
jgi:hypothetical protein